MKSSTNEGRQGIPRGPYTHIHVQGVAVWVPEAVPVRRLSRVPLAAAPLEALPVTRLAVPARKAESWGH